MKINVTIFDENTVCASTNISVQATNMWVVSVVIKQKTSTKEIITHEVRNTCSQRTFIMVDLVGALGIDGITTSVMVKMLIGQSRLKSKLVDVSPISHPSDQKFWINLPHCYTKKELPVDLEEILSPEKLRRWHYLQALKQFKMHPCMLVS